MSKWPTPRHKPRKITDCIKADVNHGKRRRRKKLARLRRESEAKAEAFIVCKDLADAGIEAARFVLGSCSRKRGMTLRAAKKCALSIWLGTGNAIWVYPCPYCGKHHVTSHPEPGARYDYHTPPSVARGNGKAR